MGIFLLVKSISKKSKNPNIRTTYVEKSSYKYWYISLGFMMGILSNYLGIGGGWLIVPILIYIFKMSPKQAASTSVYSLLIYTTVGATTQIIESSINWIIIIIGGIGISIGANIGLYIAKKIPENLIMKLLSVVLIIMGIKNVLYLTHVLKC